MEIMKKYYKVLPFLVLLGCGWISWHSDTAIIVLRDLWLILSGRFNEVNSEDGWLGVILVTTSVLSVGILFWVVRILTSTKKSSSHFLYSEFQKGVDIEFLIGMVLGVFLEELVFRWFVFSVLTKLHFLSGGVGFYILFILSNSVFALIHLYNYRDKKERKVNKILGHFVMSILFSYIYLKYGLVATTMVHLVNNLFWVAYIVLIIKCKGFKYVEIV